ncbi:MAG TPA: ferredoxin family protein [Planctomycetota bacterium]|nr:ferredoxin family protein [Planctomycetota bacterium]
MAYIIAEPCIGTKDRACVPACPVDCIHPTKDEDKGEISLYIHPDECIDCGACVEPCPVDAIYAQDELPDKWKGYVEINAEYFKMTYPEFAAKWNELHPKTK